MANYTRAAKLKRTNAEVLNGKTLIKDTTYHQMSDKMGENNPKLDCILEQLTVLPKGHKMLILSNINAIVIHTREISPL